MIASGATRLDMGRNAAEIADSDEDSEVPALASRYSLRNGLAIPDVDLGVNLEDLLRQSQGCQFNDSQTSLSGIEQPEGAGKSTGTTASLRRQIETEQRKLAEQRSSPSGPLSSIKTNSASSSSDSPMVAKTKRRHSDLVTTCPMDVGQHTKRKRQRTCNSNSSHLRSSQSAGLADEHRNHGETSIAEQCSPFLNDPPEPAGDPDPFIELQTVAEHHPLPTSALSCQIEGQPALHGQDVILPHYGDSSLNPHIFKDYVQGISGRISTSRSLMGNYESINLDFGESGSGLGFDANPFEDAPRQSGEGHNDPLGGERLRTTSRPPSAGAANALSSPSPLLTYTEPPFDSYQSALEEGPSLQIAASARPETVRSKSYIDPSVLTRGPRDTARESLHANLSSSRKRRKTVNGASLNITLMPGEEQILQPTVLPVDVALPGVETQGQKRGKKPKSQAGEPNEDAYSEQARDQDSHGKIPTHNHGAAEKQVSNELYFEENLAMGLPCEQYKPRPTRSRSKRTTEEEMPPPALTPIKSIQSPSKHTESADWLNAAQPNEGDDTPPTKLKKERKKKNKMKRAKTSAAALLKKSDRMLSDGEEDVVWVESKPATVKMKVPGPVEVKEQSVKDEVTHLIERKSTPDACHDAAGKEHSNDDASAEAAGASADGPELQLEEQKRPLKKRSRKKKDVNDTAVSNENEDGPTEVSNVAAEPCDEVMGETADDFNPCKTKGSSSNQALKEKDVNTIIHNNSNKSNTTSSLSLRKVDEPTLTSVALDLHCHSTSSPSKVIHPSPAAIDSSETRSPPTPPSATSKSQLNDMTNHTTTTNKSPTKHSPINPAGGIVKYRVGLSKRATIPPLLKIVRK